MALFCFGLIVPAAAQEVPQTSAQTAAQVTTKAAVPFEASIAVIDVQAVMREALAHTQLQKELESLRGSYQKDIAAQQEAIRQAERELAEGRGKLSPEDLSRKSKAFEKQVAELQNRVQERKKTLDQAYSNAMQMFQNELVEQVSRYSKENNIEIVLRRSQVFLADRELDITKQIIDQLNKALPKIDIDPDKPVQ